MTVGEAIKQDLKREEAIKQVLKKLDRDLKFFEEDAKEKGDKETLRLIRKNKQKIKERVYDTLSTPFLASLIYGADAQFMDFIRDLKKEAGVNL